MDLVGLLTLQGMWLLLVGTNGMVFIFEYGVPRNRWQRHAVTEGWNPRMQISLISILFTFLNLNSRVYETGGSAMA